MSKTISRSVFLFILFLSAQMLAVQNETTPEVQRIRMACIGQIWKRNHLAQWVDPKVSDAYVGQYELAPNFVLTISKEGARVMAEATGQPKVEIFAEAEL